MKRISLFLVAVLLSACSLLPQTKTTQITPLQGKNDHREYRHLRLDNGLSVLLVSDPDTDVSAASMDVYVGSGSDPQHRQGLAHFLEHMLFLGTEEYPQADAYQRYIRDNAGSHNAYTSFEHTNYFFSISPGALEGALDRFSRFFVSPLLDEAYTEREVNAVHSEYETRLHDEHRRRVDVIKELMNPDHPFAKFSIGNLDTLSSDESPIQADLKAFYQQHYTAGNMALVVLGKENLSQLQDMVEARFTDIRDDQNKSRQKADRRIAEPQFEADTLPGWVDIQPIKELRELSLIFPVPDLRDDYESKPFHLISHVLGHEGKGSLYSYLKTQGLLESLSAGLAWRHNGSAAFTIRMNLTEAGMAQKDDVIEAVFQAIEGLRDGLPQWMFDELGTIAAMQFDYDEAAVPMRHVLRLANNMHYYPPEHILAGDYRFDKYNPQLVDRVLEKLRPENGLFVMIGDEFVPQQVSQFHFAPYAARELDEKLLQRLQHITKNPAITLPEKNPFVPQTLALVDDLPQQKTPQQIVKSDYKELWYKPLDRFQLPKAVSYYSLMHPQAGVDARASVLLDVYAALLNDNLNEWVYPASRAGLDFDFYAHPRGMTLRISGFSDRQHTLLSTIVDQLEAMVFSQEQFDRTSSRLLRNWQNELQEPPYQRAMSSFSTSLRSGAYPAQEKSRALQSITLEDVNAFTIQFVQNARLRAFNNGNLSKAGARAMLEEFARWAGSGQKTGELSVWQLEEPAQHIMHSPHNDALYALYWQGPDNDFASQAEWMLLGQALSADFYHQLRTEKQLGYVVFARYYPVYTVPGLLFMIQSPVADVDGLHQHVSAYLAQAAEHLKQLPADDFKQYRESLLDQLNQQNNSLDEESSRYWYELALGFTRFDLRDQQAEAVQQLQLEDWRQFVTELLQQDKPLQYLISTDSDVLPGFIPIEANVLPGKKRYLYQ